MPDPITNPLTAWPLWHFAKLESALERGDDRAAEAAVHQLERLGIEVRFRIPLARVRWKVANASR